MPGGGARGQNLEQFTHLYSFIFKVFMSSYLGSSYLGNPRLGSFDTWTQGTQEDLKASGSRVHAPWVGQKVVQTHTHTHTQPRT